MNNKIHLNAFRESGRASHTWRIVGIEIYFCWISFHLNGFGFSSLFLYFIFIYFFFLCMNSRCTQSMKLILLKNKKPKCKWSFYDRMLPWKVDFTYSICLWHTDQVFPKTKRLFRTKATCFWTQENLFWT